MMQRVNEETKVEGDRAVSAMTAKVEGDRAVSARQ